jgi:hypothetical protein
VHIKQAIHLNQLLTHKDGQPDARPLDRRITPPNLPLPKHRRLPYRLQELPKLLKSPPVSLRKDQKPPHPGLTPRPTLHPPQQTRPRIRRHHKTLYRLQPAQKDNLPLPPLRLTQTIIFNQQLQRHKKAIPGQLPKLPIPRPVSHRQNPHSLPQLPKRHNPISPTIGPSRPHPPPKVSNPTRRQHRRSPPRRLSRPHRHLHEPLLSQTQRQPRPTSIFNHHRSELYQ